MNYPDEATLIARGKWATLGQERRSQIERVQKISKTVMHLANPFLGECQEEPIPENTVLETMQECLRHAEHARKRLIEITQERASIKQQAWGTR